MRPLEGSGFRIVFDMLVSLFAHRETQVTKTMPVFIHTVINQALWFQPDFFAFRENSLWSEEKNPLRGRPFCQSN